jgi:hypothetical protein
MANYMGNSPSYSLLDDMEFRTAFSGQPQTQQQASAQQEGLLSPSTAQAAARGAQSGGLSGALISGGVNSMLTSGMAAGGPYAIAGGLLLSELQAAQEAKARQEAEMIANEKQRRSDMQNMLQQNSRTRFMV